MRLVKVFSLIFILLITEISIADTKGTNDKTDASNSQLTAADTQKIRDLLKQVNELKEEVNKETNTKNKSKNNQQFATYSSQVGNLIPTDKNYLDLETNQIRSATYQDIASNITENSGIEGSINNNKNALSANGGPGIDVNGTAAITTKGEVTYLGSYSGNNTIPIGMISSNLFASTLLGQRERFDDYTIFFGGYIEADAQTWFGSEISRANGMSNFPSNGQNIYLTNSKLYFLSNLGHYVTAQFDFDTDETGSFGLGNAFVMFGNLDTSPFFVTAGRSKLSVGVYGGGGPWTSGIIDEFLSPDKVSNISLNYKDETFNANIAVFGSDDKRANFSTALFYADTFSENLSGGFNIGYVYNIAGAGNGGIQNFLQNIDRENDNVGVLNFDGNISYAMLGGIWQLQGGWSATTHKEDFNGDGNNVNTGAWYTGIAYALNLGGRNTNFNITYGESYNAAQVPMPLSNASPTFGQTISGIKKQFIASAQRAYFDDNVLFGPEYSYQRLYNDEHMNTLTLDLSVYI
ncbi:DUF3573 domain-containing protein [Francisella sp. Scap27]|jgi:hypothetical protein|uniref:DUF3573 domain-containing protein n=1 Tax=Francisella sp. Scap27 TaxID=2589986 RepID=UPI0015B989AE|nr:DUF3573 domain-containing protein [Francisella sp. Scap27]QLE79150.1 DUF3573 domain-containing protein [Francisella sp. Scap27]